MGYMRMAHELPGGWGGFRKLLKGSLERKREAIPSAHKKIRPTIPPAPPPEPSRPSHQHPAEPRRP